MTVCESNPVEGGRYHYVMVLPEHGLIAWHGTYTNIDRPDGLGADEWFVMGDADPTGPPTAQTLTFEPTGSGFTLMTMQVNLPEPEDPETFIEQSAAGLTTSLATMDELVDLTTCPRAQCDAATGAPINLRPASPCEQARRFTRDSALSSS